MPEAIRDTMATIATVLYPPRFVFDFSHCAMPDTNAPTIISIYTDYLVTPLILSRVLGPKNPVVDIFLDAWYALTAAKVLGPKTPGAEE